jgi:hypothetical protein
MGEKIFVLDNDGVLQELNEASYISEDMLQQLLANYPNLISGSQINTLRPRRWLLVSREFGVPDEQSAANRWSLDHLFIDQDGIPTLVEVKRSTDSRIRREVVGQILDYAANAVSYWIIEEIRYRFFEHCKKAGKETSQVLEELLQNEIDADQFWEITKSNLKAGKIRMLIIADKIPRELQRVIEFLNEQMQSAEILGLEIKQFTGLNNLKTLVPRVIGQTTTAEDLKGNLKVKREQWNEDAFIDEIAKQRGQKEREIVKQILEWLHSQQINIWYGKGRRGSLVPWLNLNSIDYQLFAIWIDGSVEIYFQWYKNKPPFSDEHKRLELLEKLNQIKGVNIPKEKINVRPSFSIGLLADKEEYQKFIDTFKWFLHEIKETNPNSSSSNFSQV